jgi:hypothetical protein
MSDIPFKAAQVVEDLRKVFSHKHYLPGRMKSYVNQKCWRDLQVRVSRAHPGHHQLLSPDELHVEPVRLGPLVNQQAQLLVQCGLEPAEVHDCLCPLMEGDAAAHDASTGRFIQGVPADQELIEFLSAQGVLSLLSKGSQGEQHGRVALLHLGAMGYDPGGI